MPVAIVSDTCHYLPRELVAENGIREVSLYVHSRGETIRESEITDYDDYYARLHDLSELPTTSQPSIGDFLAVYEPLLDGGNEIVSVHLAGGMSGTYASAQQAREQLGSRADRVHVIDSETACGGEGLLLLAAAAAARDGADGAATADRVRRARSQLKMWFAIETLEYLRRGGPDRRRPGLARLGAEDQADPQRRVRDHAGRARAHLEARIRADGRPAAHLQGGRLRRLDGPAHPGAGAGRASWPPAAAR